MTPIRSNKLRYRTIKTQPKVMAGRGELIEEWMKGYWKPEDIIVENDFENKVERLLEKGPQGENWPRLPKVLG